MLLSILEEHFKHKPIAGDDKKSTYLWGSKLTHNSVWFNIVVLKSAISLI